jgi:uncharacterized protein YbjT (DUF2867 family)
MKAVLIGATGATGKVLLQQLIASEKITEITALVRKPLDFSHPKLQELVVNFDSIEEWENHISGDVAFSCLGTTLKAAGSKEAQYKVDYKYQYEFAQVAKASNIPSFILISSSGADPKSLIFYSRMKGELEKSIEDLNFNSFTAFRPGPLVRPDSDRAGEKTGVAVISFLNKIGFFRSMAPLEVEDLAKLMLHYAINHNQGFTILESGRILKEIKKQ